MRIVKAMIIAFSMYSKIPMPQFEWKDEDMKYMLCFFPWIGAVIGGCIYFWGMICEKYEISLLCYTLIGTAIPLLITGDFMQMDLWIPWTPFVLISCGKRSWKY